VIDPEALFTRVAAGDWAGALDLVRREPDRLPDDPVTGQALELLVSAIDGRLGGEDLADDDVERYLLLGRAGRLPVGRGREARAVESLMHRYRELPERALAIARFRPDLPGAIAVIGQYGRPEASRVEAGGGTHRVTSAAPGPGAADAGRPLFRSPIERAFHAAACRVFPGAVVQCNVALHAALDFDRIRGRLTSDERRHFFHGLVDCVVFDPGREYRPVRFYELDSAVHDDAVRQERDGLKDRILSVAGHRLLRIRPAGASGDAAGEEALERLLRALEESDSVYIDGPEGCTAPESRAAP
jgi:hypothetical protein